MRLAYEDRGRTALQLAGWFLAGAALSSGLLAALTIGPVLWLVAVVLIVVTLRLGGGNASAYGALAGVGATLLYVAWLNRNGPGNVCVSTPTEQSCTEEWSPWPWLAAGLLLVGVGVTALVALAPQRRVR
jgi:hypothetical protein